MNPIDFLKTKHIVSEFQKYMENRNTGIEIVNFEPLTVDIKGDMSMFLNEILALFDINKDNSNLFYKEYIIKKLPFKIRNIESGKYKSIVFYIPDIDFCKGARVYLKTLENFSDHCDGNLNISRGISVQSLKGIGYVKGDLIVDLENSPDYRTKQDVLKDYPDLKIGGYLTIMNHQFISLNNPFGRIIKFNDKYEKNE